MKWVNVKNTSSKEHFELRKGEEVLADITFSKQTRFVRIVSKLGKRMFTFEKSGLLTQARVIRDEYGFKLGKVEEIRPDKGIVELNGKSYFYIYDLANKNELQLYDESMQQKMFTCSFADIVSALTNSRSLLDSKFASLLLLFCWYSAQCNIVNVYDTELIPA